MIVCIVVSLALVVLLIVAQIEAYLARRRGMAGLAKRLGFVFQAAGEVPAELAGFQPFGIGEGRIGSNYMFGRIRGLRTTMFDYQYATGSAANQDIHRFLVLAVELPLFSPGFAMIHHERLVCMEPGAGSEFIADDEALDRRYRFSGDPSYGARVLSGDMREFLRQVKPSNWQMKGQMLVVFVPNARNGKAAEVWVESVTRFLLFLSVNLMPQPVIVGVREPALRA
jgi:hypothetical protein